MEHADKPSMDDMIIILEHFDCGYKNFFLIQQVLLRKQDRVSRRTSRLDLNGCFMFLKCEAPPDGGGASFDLVSRA
jgi:hypothetical protein